jgi:hypothetical protein
MHEHDDIYMHSDMYACMVHRPHSREYRDSMRAW